MSQPPRPAPSHVPTLTEVIEIPEVLPTPVQPTTGVVEALASEPASTWMAPAVVDSVQPTETVGILAPLVPAAVPAAVPLAMPPLVPVVTSLVAAPTAPVSVPEPLPIPASLLKPALAPVPPLSSPAPAPAPLTPARGASGLDEAAMAQRVLSEVQRQIDGMLEYRLREALTPILARTSESLVRELRQELSKTMRDVVSRAVAQEVARQRSRS
ncbi:MAG: hypothetical protein WAQ08_20960 [Aquabacterium sp.]|jgi:hypothetical protein|uniref:hypothetical protein n=1 Tax=Aquabacterium sp. TaxID=1872578 RepID=UPI003BB1D01E